MSQISFSRVTRIVVAAALSVSALSASAALLNVPVPSNAYITKGGLDWAWAYPLLADSGIDLSYQSTQGWRLPTAAELTNAPLATDFMKAGANVPLGGTDAVSGAGFHATNATLTGPAACATPYFSTSYTHCDWWDGLGQVNEPWAGMPNARDFADQLVVRKITPIVVAPVPALELEGLALLSLSLLGVAWARSARRN